TGGVEPQDPGAGRTGRRGECPIRGIGSEPRESEHDDHRATRLRAPRLRLPALWRDAPDALSRRVSTMSRRAAHPVPARGQGGGCRGLRAQDERHPQRDRDQGLTLLASRAHRWGGLVTQEGAGYRWGGLVTQEGAGYRMLPVWPREYRPGCGHTARPWGS